MRPRSGCWDQLLGPLPRERRETFSGEQILLGHLVLVVMFYIKIPIRTPDIFQLIGMDVFLFFVVVVFVGAKIQDDSVG